MMSGRTATGQGRTGRGFVVRIVRFVWLVALLVGCTPGPAGEIIGATPARPTTSPLPAVATNAPLPEQLHLRPAASDTHTLIVQPDDGRAPIVGAINALQAAVNRGVTVRVMMEEKPCCAQNNAMQRSVFAELQEARVQVQWTNPAFRLTHTKMLLVDSERVFVMTQNLTKSSFQYNREATIISRDAQDVQTAQAIFDADWHRTSFVPNAPNFVVANLNARAKLLALIGGTKLTLDVASEAMQDAQIEDALIAAARRGVAVRVIGSLPPPGGTGGQDTNAAGRKHIASGGVAVHVLATPYVHTKTVVADGAVAFVGSVNFTAASMDNNREVGILTENAAVIARLAQVFAKDWAAAKLE